MFKKFFIVFSILATLSGAGVFGVTPAFAQVTDSLTTVGETTGLGVEDPKVIVGKLIRTALGFLGILATLIVLYGGYRYMTAGGDAEKATTAKKILINGGIGLTIILLSYAITSFVITAILGATGAGDGAGGGGSGGGGNGGLGGGSAASFTVTSIRPSGELSIRNVQVVATFSRKVGDVDSSAITLVDASGAAVAGTVTASGNAITFKPTQPCPAPNEDYFCFAADTLFTVTVSDALKSSTGTRISCGASCTGTFTTGSIVDTESPFAELTFPDNGARLPYGGSSNVQAEGTDDYQVATISFIANEEVLDVLPASGDNLADVILETLWDYSAFAEKSVVALSAVVTDLAGNTDSSDISVRIKPAYCSNGVLDASSGETGVDCGGDCGACDGGSCAIDSDCESGFCDDGVCASTPIISSVLPTSGGPGTFVTLTGTGFGRSGMVLFAGTTEPVEAMLASCAAGWSATELVVEVPVGAIDGPISLVTGGSTETTNDDHGPVMEDFDVTTETGINLCKITPSSGYAGSSLSLSGSGFGSEGDASEILFSGRSGIRTTRWDSEAIQFVAPTLDAGTYAVTVSQDGRQSNPVSFGLLASGSSAETETLPVVSYVTPENGGIGQTVTIVGSNFGSAIGKVWFEDTITGDRGQGSADFPAECDALFWSDHQITILVPDAYTNGSDVLATAHTLYIARQDGKESNSVGFSITTEDPLPGICGMNPASGVSGDTVNIYGSNFGSDGGDVRFYNESAAGITSWSEDQITATVPSSAQTGPVTIASIAGAESNGVNFEIADFTAGAGIESATPKYSWVFSTGDIPLAPEAIIACTDENISGVPNSTFTSGVCLNASVYVEFTMPMAPTSLTTGEGGSFLVESCTDSTCRNTTPVDGVLSATSDGTGVFFDPLSLFAASTTYRVVLTTDLTSSDGVSLLEETSWTFTTGLDGSACQVEKVLLNPKEIVATSLNEAGDFNALPISTNCIALNPADYAFDWAIDESLASKGDCDPAVSSCMQATALAEGTATVLATERLSAIDGTGEFIIDFSDPYVTTYWPNCSQACTNALVGARFNVSMDPSIETVGMATLYKCANELCANLTAGDIVAEKASCVASPEGDCMEISFSVGSLSPSTFYHAIISGEVISESGTALTKTNDGEDFSWEFSTKADGSVCAVERTALSPSDVLLGAIGEAQVFAVSAYGAPDECSVAGQELDADDYAWNWEDPIKDEIDVASWYKLLGSGTFFDKNPAALPAGCTSSCIALGSTSYTAICGNAVLETGEECDDKNVVPGDGCSANCLREGLLPGATCGDGVLDRDDIGAGEDCDDKNTISGDGCSATCLNEGSSASGGTCGNNDVGYTEDSGGEDCDDGNKKNGDGCSSKCLAEGSPRLSDISAICGDGVVTAPYETCDGGARCTSACLRAGGTALMGCGDGVVVRTETDGGEDCDDGNTENDDGCSSACLFEGSSLSYVNPSVCGDGHAGTGEDLVCELGASGDGNVDASQVAYIASTAVSAVNVDTQKATGTIRVVEAASSVSTEALISLSCVAKTASDCSDSTRYGVASNACCMPRPTAELIPNGTDTCRNAAVYGLFSQEMDVASFTGNAYVKLNTPSCPTDEGYTVVSNAGVPGAMSFFEKFFAWITPTIFAQSANDCVMPITKFSQEQLESGLYKVTFETEGLFAIGGAHTIVLEGDDTAGEGLGIKNSEGVGLYATQEQSFTTVNTICTLDEVVIADTADAPGLFTSANEAHEFVADTYSYANGSRQEIASVAGAYAWTWEPWISSESTIADVTVSTDDAATISSLEISGDAVIGATAKISENVAMPSDVGSAVSDSYDVSVVICNNPWPDYASYPFIDDATGTVDGISEGIAWMNFSTYYCRDGETLLPTLSVVAPAVTKSANVIKEYLWKIDDGSGDAIGVRIATNSNYLPPELWYASQGFAGSPVNDTVDEFEAIRDGRTVYVAAPNLVETTLGLYPNIYILSYNEGASEDTIGIFNQLLANLTFLTNVDNAGFCAESGAYTGSTCESDFDCTGTQVCADDKARIRRDLQRLTDMKTIESALGTYGSAHSTCSATTSRSCTTALNCPTGESCTPSYPVLASGTFVRALAVSSWTSWNDTFGKEVGTTLPADPLNKTTGCGSGTLSSYAADTCVDSTTGAYLCPLNSYVYHYRSIGPKSYDLTSELEYNTASWVYGIDNATGYDIVVGGNLDASVDGFTGSTALCDGSSVYGTSSSCGDGIVGASEVCELEDEGPMLACTDDAGLSGATPQICNDTCSGWETPSDAVCTSYSCGNGVIEGAETCDDGSRNGKYGSCGYDCTYTTSFYCGDGMLGGSEICDCGTASSSGRTYGGGLCTDTLTVNGVYGANPGDTCASTCSGPATYCGDRIVQSGEQCDGTIETYAGALCQAGSGTDGEGKCTSNTDCVTISVAPSGFGGGSSTSYGVCGGTGTKFDACPTTTVCLLGDSTKLGRPCTTDAFCDSSAGGDGVCSDKTFETTRTRTCEDDGAGGELCTWAETWADVSCEAEVLCGNGSVDDGEDCDDGNDSNTDACTTQCKENYCGDGYLNPEAEQCDEGGTNGVACSSSYEAGCSYCSTSCLTVASSGSFCGDGIRNGDEYCDGGDVPLLYVSDSGTVRSTCSSAAASTTDDDGTVYYCANAGICEGGSDHGETCIKSDDAAAGDLPSLSRCSGGSCVLPTCASNCASSCPFTNQTTSLLMSTNASRTMRGGSIDLKNYETLESPTSATSAMVATAGTMYVPACSSASSLRGSISFDNLGEQQVYIVFVTDTSLSMRNKIGVGVTAPTRLEVVQEKIAGVAATLYDELGDSVHLGAIGFGTLAYPTSATFYDQTELADFVTRVDALHASGGSNIADGLTLAEKMLDDVATSALYDPSWRRVIVLMTDGYTSGYYSSLRSQGCSVKASGMELYTLMYSSLTESGLSSTGVECSVSMERDAGTLGFLRTIESASVLRNEQLLSWLKPFSSIADAAPAGFEVDTCASDMTDLTQSQQMACVSSGNPSTETGIQYYFIENTKAGLQAMYDTVVEDMLGVSMSYVVDGEIVSGSVVEGNDVALPWPTGFTCSGSEQGIPVRLNFQREGTVEISNVNLQYCE
ncbi:MAG: IPT/TIG domain-containing protein [Patescibacteria group bacterium]